MEIFGAVLLIGFDIMHTNTSSRNLISYCYLKIAEFAKYQYLTNDWLFEVN